MLHTRSIALLAITLYGASLGSVFAAPTVYVDSTYSQTHAGTHVFGIDAFRTVQEGVDMVDLGGTVSVQSGTYNESVTIKKSLLLIGKGSKADIGASQDAPILDGGSATGTIIIEGTSTPVMVTIRNMYISHGNYGIAVLQNAIVNADNNTVSGYKKNGITFGSTFLPGKGGVRGTISNNNVIGIGPTDTIAQNGVQIAENNTASISGNTISNNSYTVPGKKWATGILIYRSHGVTVTKNILSFNQAGINILQASKNKLQGNTIFGNTASQAGIMVSSSDDTFYIATKNSISRNTVTGGLVGIWTSYTSGNSYTNNTISNTSRNGIYAWDSDKNTIIGNIIKNIHSPSNSAYGLALDGGDTVGSIGSTENYISGNTVTESDTTFFSEPSSHNNILLRNNF